MRIVDSFDRGVEFYPDNTVFIEGDERHSYRTIAEKTYRIANGLEALEIGIGNRFAVYSGNSVAAFTAVLGGMRTGAAWVTVNVRDSAEAIGWHLANTKTEVLFVSVDYVGNVAEIRTAAPGLRNVFCLEGAAEGIESLDDWMSGQSAERPNIWVPFDTIARVSSTGGTTGRPRAVLQNHYGNLTVTASFLISFPFHETPTYLMAAPLTHAAGNSSFSIFWYGGAVVMMKKVDVLEIMKLIEQHRVNSLLLPPTVIYMMLAHPKVREFDYSSLRYFYYGAAPMMVEKLKQAIDVFGPVMAQLYGQAEASQVILCMTPQDHVEALSGPATMGRLASAGRAGPLCQVAIMDDAGRLLPRGEIGEVVVRSSVTMVGFLNDDAATEKSRAHGWHHTGDVGRMDDDGFVYLLDRKRDMIISGGFNIYPNEVEQVLAAHPAVQDCTVVGTPHEKWGEAVTGVVELKPESQAEPDEIIAYCKEHLGGMKAPKRVEVWSELPRSTVGKVLRRKVRDRFWGDDERKI